MKPALLFALLLSAAACGQKDTPQTAAPAAPAAPPVQASTPTLTGTPEGYVNSLQNDVRKTQDVRDKANAATSQAAEEMQMGLEGQ